MKNPISALNKNPRAFVTRAITVSIAVAFAACTSPGKKTAVGAGAGAAGGAIIGGVAGGVKGAAIGAGVGAVAGGAVGNVLDKQAKELDRVADTERTADGILVKLKNDLLFPVGTATLTPGALDLLQQLAGVLVKYPQDRIRIFGHTDSTGSAQLNEDLSNRRADEVRDILAQQGVKSSQMLVAGMGENQPIASNNTSNGRSQNRRVELKIDIPEAG